MRLKLRRAAPWVLSTGMLLAFAAPAVHGQSYSNFRQPPAINQEARMIGASNVAQNQQNDQITDRYARNFRVPPSYNPYCAPTPYGNYGDPYGGYMSGVSDVINSQGQVAVSVEQARQMHEQTKTTKIDNKRKAFDEWLYERKMRPTAEDERERAQLEAMRRARNNPPSNEIWSGTALNTLLLGIQRMNAQSVQGPTVALDPESLRHINVTSGSSVGTLGLLRDGGKLQWPFVLRKSPFSSQTKKVDQLALQAYSQAQAGQVSDDTLQGLSDSVDTLQKKLLDRIDSVNANDYIRGKRYLNELDSTLKALQDPNVAKFASGKWAARGNNVYELVQNMTVDGLKFAPATIGDQPYYTALHSALVAYYQWPDQSRTWDTVAK